MAVNLAKGVFRFTTGALDKRAYMISTPSAAIGVRGTVLDIGVGARNQGDPGRGTGVRLPATAGRHLRPAVPQMHSRPAGRAASAST